RDILARGAPIDAFGIGTRLVTSADAPSLDLVYKLQEYAGRPRRKHSEGKETWPGRKQVYRRYDGSGRMRRDVVGLADEASEGEPLLRPVMQAGRRIGPSPALGAVREHAAGELRRLPDAQRALQTKPAYPVKISRALQALAAATEGDLSR
ncbi:MAG: nicotinate phosphoribosyltransferase, partial [Candidatus Binatia bacterium]